MSETIEKIVKKRIEDYKKTNLTNSAKEKNRIAKCLKLVILEEYSLTQRMIIEKAKIHKLI